MPWHLDWLPPAEINEFVTEWNEYVKACEKAARDAR